MKSLLLALATVLFAAPGFAQRSIHLGVGGGVVVPVGKLDSTYATGPSGLVMLAMGPQDSPFGLRLDYGYNELRGRTVGGTAYGDIHMNAATANAVFTVRAGYLKPYLLAGGGWYPFRPAGADRENRFGANVGAGLGFPLPHTPIGGFIEVRYHDVRVHRASDVHFVPITIGIMF